MVSIPGVGCGVGRIRRSPTSRVRNPGRSRGPSTTSGPHVGLLTLASTPHQRCVGSGVRRGPFLRASSSRPTHRQYARNSRGWRWAIGSVKAPGSTTGRWQSLVIEASFPPPTCDGIATGTPSGATSDLARAVARTDPDARPRPRRPGMACSSRIPAGWNRTAGQSGWPR